MEFSVGQEVQYKPKNRIECYWHIIAQVNKVTLDLYPCDIHHLKIRVPKEDVHTEYCQYCT